MRLLSKITFISSTTIFFIAGISAIFLLDAIKSQLLSLASNAYQHTVIKEIISSLSIQLWGAVILGVLITTLIWFFVLQHYLVRRLKLLHKSVDAIGNGALSTRVVSTNTDEVGDLGRAINHMAETLEHSLISKKTLDLEMKKRQKVLSDLAEQKFALDKHAIVAVTDIQGTITYVNERFCLISGYSEEELIGQNHRMLNSGTHSKTFFREMYRCIAKGEVWSGELCNRAKDRRLYWVDTTIVPLKGENGKPRSYIAIRADITERKNAEIALAESSRKLELIISSTEVGVWDWDIETGTVDFNERWAEIVGYKLEELQPTTINTWTQLAHPDELVESEKRLNDHWNNLTDHYSFEARMKHKNGQWVWVLDTGKVVEWLADGKPKRMIGTHLDITERKYQELASQAAQVALEQAKEAAEKAANAKGEFLASMSHEIRTPMNGVLGMLELLQNSSLSQDQRRKVDIAQSSAQSLLTLINDILDYSKVDAGKLELESIDFDLLNMMSEFAEGMAYQAQKKHLELVLDMSEVQYSIVRGDAARLRQILTNLVGNAIKFTDQGDVVIKGKLAELNEHQWRFSCAIIDTGIGIPDENLKSLFQSFSQLDASTTRKYGGTGLGLAIVKKLCELMGGKVTVSSVPKFGSCFEIEILLGKSEQEKKIEPAKGLEGLNVLIVDDNSMNREVMQSQLRIWGISASVAANAELAWQTAEAQLQKSADDCFDIVFIDIHLPDLEGVALGSKFKSDPRFKGVKVVMMTNITQQNQSQLFADLGFSAYCQKPITVSDLFDTLAIATHDDNMSNLVLKSENNYLQKTLSHSGFDLKQLKKTWPKEARVLLVEDNDINQMVATGILQELGLQVDVASNGEEALAFLRHHLEPAYHLVFMDCQMPKMDGYEASRQIRAGQAGEKNKEIAIIAMTANAMTGDKEKCLASGMNDYLSKPLVVGDIVSKLNLYLTGDKLSKTTTSSNTTVIPSLEQRLDNDHEADWQSLEAWQVEEMLHRMMGIESSIIQLLKTFLRNLPEQLSQLQSAVKQQNWAELCHQAHALKGAAANLSAKRLSYLSAKLERAGKKQDVDALSIWFEPFTNSAKELQSLIEQYLLNIDSSDANAVTLNLSEFRSCINQLRQQLEASEYIDVTELDRLNISWLSAESQATVQQLIAQISEFDEAGALSTLDALVKIISQEQPNE
ncbi:PAS domain S-box-containing protein [Oceanospirillum multiglobuliferum]|uniref:Sensory/regulatory protein RpfC n=1 Tax=Oceanospirillum multiglobuliferum TaxID=64969 RepID=A0A1T4PU24_9GAMM|nr:response regulator [Oceanospirillum multiglobuliferum]OPX55328.1 hypothetical protein BTE48_09170 [Oceanospirillum multiglobuliferum]SJZ94737.1 PAS domain S-box-containing protein [Oceanospirillum multiglobuliferum]